MFKWGERGGLVGENWKKIERMENVLTITTKN